MNAPALFSLSKHDRTTALWRALAEHYADRLTTLRIQNDATCDADKTAFRRGQIAECKAFLALADDSIQIDD